MAQGVWKKRLSLLAALILGSALVDCTGLSPASAPAPVAEIPSAVSFPDSVAIDTPEVGPAGPTSIALASFQAYKSEVLPVGGEFFDAILFGFNTNTLVNQAVEGVLLEFSIFEFPVNPIIRNFTGVSPLSGQTLKIDFSDYDFFDNGGTVGCTGCTCPVGCDVACPIEAPPEAFQPICYRIWNDPFENGQFVPLMAGFMTQLPIKDDPNTPQDESNPGAGAFKVGFANQTPPGEPLDNTNLAANYNHRNAAAPFNLVSEYIFNVINPPGEELEATVSHLLVQQQAISSTAPSPDHLMKTIQESVNQPIPSEPNADSTFQYTARFRNDLDFWSGTFQDFLRFPNNVFSVPPDIENFTAECAQLTTAVGVDEATCVDIGIDVTNVPFLELLSPNDTRAILPSDFPPTPDF